MNMNFPRKTNLIVVLISLLPLVLACDSSKTKILARVGNSLITLDQFEREFLQSRPVRMIENATLEDKQAFLTKLIDRKVRTQFAYRMGIDKETDVSRQINLVEQRTA
ncbi:MAG: hypothetical protein V3U73_12375, partial [bacterium]